MLVAQIRSALTARGLPAMTVEGVTHAVESLTWLLASPGPDVESVIRRALASLEEALAPVAAPPKGDPAAERRAAVEAAVRGQLLDGAPRAPRDLVDAVRGLFPEGLPAQEVVQAVWRLRDRGELVLHTRDGVRAVGLSVLPVGAEEARQAARLGPFPVRGMPRRVRWAEVPAGSIGWVPPGTAKPGPGWLVVRWPSYAGSWVNAAGSSSGWAWEARREYVADVAVWIVAEELTDVEIWQWANTPVDDPFQEQPAP